MGLISASRSRSPDDQCPQDACRQSSNRCSADERTLDLDDPVASAPEDSEKKQLQAHKAGPVHGSCNEKGAGTAVEALEQEKYERMRAKSEHRFKRLSWQRLAICLIVEAVALGTLSLPSAFATVGLVPGVLLTIGIGLIVIYTAHVVGAACNNSPTEVLSYVDLGERMFGRWGREVFTVMFMLIQLLASASHTLTGAIAFTSITNGATCSIVWSVVSAILLFVLALPPSFTEFAILGVIDFISLIAAVVITMIATGIQATNLPGGRSTVDWHAFPQEKPSFVQAFVAVSNIVFAYSFIMGQPTVQAELRQPNDYMKAVWAIGLTEVTIYTLTGSIIYVFVGSGVQSPALLSAGPLVSRIVFGIALPLIFISGSILVNQPARYIHQRILGETRHRWISTKTGILVWLLINAIFVAVAFLVAQAIPTFSSLLSLTSALFISSFNFIFPALIWWLLLRKGKWNDNWHNIVSTIINLFVFLLGALVLVAGTYASVVSIIGESKNGRRPFSCAPRN
ncbi:hypothetical protein K437DRAFT_260112 [Tilletiaria anomala UBC 951]|uniref:Amino acid transporter transmembrane domain-containing protein n=1 Tax=Tilletiaria anomala (strain ATCC 24038 / CBS 436.72 / UBC 951) TaxID=1037660 RepID=A0A066VCJ9_TILAU|nr:uncharacterized protein K437DRAFT_260112 [Tilletiaria anomala UBC 951]KDN36489.1 hypothetical protein K437DRAFT_260112 [Tilletiaria anomala UBC 951]